MDPTTPFFSPLEARIIGVLIEKQATVPDTYPLTLNSLVSGCNQKTARSPVMSVTDAEAQVALDDLRGRTLVMETFGASGRVLRYAHNLGKVIDLPNPHVALLAVLMLRGPQTPGELRINCERLHSFADISAMEAYLEELAARSRGALAVKLPRRPGEREARWAHLLCGPVEAEAGAGEAMGDESVTAGELASLKGRVNHLEAEAAELRALVERLYAELGVAR